MSLIQWQGGVQIKDFDTTQMLRVGLDLPQNLPSLRGALRNAHFACLESDWTEVCELLLVLVVHIVSGQ
jgi:hypothetical protein